MAQSSPTVLAAAQAHVHRVRVRLAPFFENFDRLRKRLVTMEQAVRALASAGLSLNPAQTAELRAWSGPDGRFEYMAFLDEVNAGLGETKGLERRPDALLATLEATETLPSGAGGLSGNPPSLSREEEAAAEAALHRLAVLCGTHGVHLPSFLRQFDRSGRGVVTVPQLDRALATAVPSLSAADRKAVARAFTWDAGTRSARVSARQLARAVQERDPSLAAHDNSAMTSFHAGPSSGSSSSSAAHPGLVVTAALSHLPHATSEAEAKEAEELPTAAARCLASLRKQCLQRRIRLRDAFVDYDPLHRGSVTLPQFVRAVLALPLAGLPASDVEALGRAHPDFRRDQSAEPSVDYSAVCARVEEAFGAAPNAEHDPLAVPPVYGAAAGMTSTTKRMGAGATKSSSSSSAVVGAVEPEAARVEPELPPHLVEPCKRALRWIRTRVRQRRVELVPVFKDYDRTHEEHVTAAQFLRALRTLGLMPEDEEEVTALLARFRGQGATRQSHVHWRSFRDAVDPPSDAQSLPAAHARAAVTTRSSSSSSSSSSSTAAALLARLKAWAVRDGVRVSELLRDADPLRHGEMSAARAVSSLSAGGFAVHPGDAASLAAAYASASGAKDAAGQPLVDWRQLSEDVEAAFGPRGLEQMPEADVERLRADALLGTSTIAGRSIGVRAGEGGSPEAGAQLLGRFTVGGAAASSMTMLAAAAAAASGGGGLRLSEIEAETLTATLRRLGTWTSTRGVDVPPLFLSFDRLHHGTVGEPRFRRCLSILKLPLDPAETNLLCKAFASGAASTASGRGDVSWAWLVAGLDAPEAVVAALPPPGATLTRSGATDAAAGAAGGVAAFGGVSGLSGPLALSRRLEEERQAGLHGGAGAVNEAVEEVRRRCAARRTSLKEHLAPFDKLHTGRVTAVKLRAALAMAGLDLSPRVLAALEAGFRSDADAETVDWRELVEAVEGGGREAASLARHPEATLSSTKPRKPMLEGAVADPSLATSDSVAAAALSEVSKLMRQRRIDLKPRLADFDRQRRGVVPAARFRSVLAGDFRSLSGEQLSALSRAFASRDAAGMVAWRPFLEAVE